MMAARKTKQQAPADVSILEPKPVCLIYGNDEYQVNTNARLLVDRRQVRGLLRGRAGVRPGALERLPRTVCLLRALDREHPRHVRHLPKAAVWP